MMCDRNVLKTIKKIKIIVIYRSTKKSNLL